MIARAMAPIACVRAVAGLAALLLVFAGSAARADTVEQRFAAPARCRRVTLAAGSYGDYLRRLPLKPEGSKVHDHSGQVVQWGSALGAVLDVDLIKTSRWSDLQQCADLALRLWAEYRWSKKTADTLTFTLQNGQSLSWNSWRSGIRGRVIANRHRFFRTAKPDASYRNFRAYLGYVMTWLGSAGLKAYAAPVKEADLAVGDLYVQNQTGAIGHASIIVDLCEKGTEKGTEAPERGAEVREIKGAKAGTEVLFLVAQSYMPAQEGQVMLPAAGEGEGAWFTLEGLKRHQQHFGDGVFRRLR